MVDVMKTEKDGVIDKLQTTYVNGILEFFEIWVNYYKYETSEDAPKIDNEKGAKALLQIYFKCAPKKSMLKTTKNSFTNFLISKREDCITFTPDAKLIEINIE